MNVIDMHCDTLLKLWEARRDKRELSLRNGKELRVNLEKMKAGGYLLQNFAVFVDIGEEENPYEAAMEMAEIFREEMDKNKDLIRPAASYGDILENERLGLMSGMMTLEEGAVCQGEVEKLQEFYRCGARMMTLGWNYENELGWPSELQPDREREYHAGEKRELGLKERGFLFVEEMERLGMIVDVSHLSDDGFFDVWEKAKRPFVASHSNARSLCGHKRNLTDQMIRMLGERGGVAGLNYFPEFICGPVTGKSDWQGNASQAEKTNSGEERHMGLSRQERCLEALARHAVHMINAGGSECVGLGSDFDGFGLVGSPQDASRVQDLAWALHKQGLAGSQIDGILHQNVRKLYREILK